MTAGVGDVPAEVQAKARRMSLWVGGMAGLFGSLVGVGGGVLISPIIANACRCAVQKTRRDPCSDIHALPYARGAMLTKPTHQLICLCLKLMQKLVVDDPHNGVVTTRV